MRYEEALAEAERLEAESGVVHVVRGKPVERIEGDAVVIGWDYSAFAVPVCLDCG